MRGKHHPRELVARIKGAARAGIKHKTIAMLTGVAAGSIRHYACGNVYKDVEPDEFPVERLRAWLLTGTD